MTKFFKACAKGLLYIVAFPFLIAVICIYGVVGLFIFIFLLFKSVVLFFQGQTIFSDLPEDKKAKKIIAEQQAALANASQPVQAANNQASPLSIYPSDSTMYTNGYQSAFVEQVKPEENHSVEIQSTEDPANNEGEQ